MTTIAFLAKCGNGGKQTCCNQVVDKDDDDLDIFTKIISGFFSPNVDNMFSSLGFDCITVAGGGQSGDVASTGCNQQGACCASNTQFGTINFGCFPINIKA